LASGNLEKEGFKAADLGPAHMLLFSGHVAAPFRSVRMAGRRKKCFACGDAPELTRESMKNGDVDYGRFCGVTPRLQRLAPEERISVAEYRELMGDGGKEHLLLDVREEAHFGIASLDGAVNVPYRALMRDVGGEGTPEWMPLDLKPEAPIYVICRQGEDSQH